MAWCAPWRPWPRIWPRWAIRALITPLGRVPFVAHLSEICLAFFQGPALTPRSICPDAVHIATEGSLGLTARRICLKHGIAFSTAFHPLCRNMPCPLRMVPENVIWRWLRWFHHPATAVMVATKPSSTAANMASSICAVVAWRGHQKFHPSRTRACLMTARSDLVGGWPSKRISGLWRSMPGPVVVGDGPAQSQLARKYPAVKFLGALTGEALNRAYAGSDVFVFPSRTDTFGLVTLEALACGLTVAAYPVEGPRDVVGPEAPGGPDVAVLDEDLRTACLGALELARHPRAVTSRAFAESHSWRACTLQFLHNIAVEPDTD